MRSYISNQVPGGADAADPGATLEEPLAKTTGLPKVSSIKTQTSGLKKQHQVMPSSF